MTASITADYSASPETLSAILEAMVEIRQPVMVWGQPGVGKSQIARDTAERLGMEYVDIRLPLMDAVDLRGIPQITADGTTRWCPPAFLPPSNSQRPYLINLEELPSCAPSLQVAAYQLLLDRRIGEYELPPKAAVIACGNRQQDRAVAQPMSTALKSRFVHVDLKTTVGEWTRWAIEADLASEVIFFMQFRPELLNNFDPRSKDHTFACPRSWEFVSKVLTGGGLDGWPLRLAIRGAVGEGPAVEFAAFLDIWEKLPHPAAVIRDPHAAPTFPDEPQVAIALCGSLFRAADDTNFDAIVTYAERLRPELGEFLVGSAARRSPAVTQTRAYIRWVARNQ